MIEKIKTKLHSDSRDFGILFTILTISFSFYSLYSGKIILGLILITISIALGLITVMQPQLLTFFKKFWVKFGEAMSKVTSPNILGIIFFALIAPIAVITRFFGRDILHLKASKSSSYWRNRNSFKPKKDSFHNQF